jgi:hypothetical protein
MSRMKMKFTAAAATLVLCLSAFALPAAADDGTTGDLAGVTDPGAEALHHAISAFRVARSAEAECRRAASDECKTARSEARAMFESVRADAVVAHKQFSERMLALREAKNPEARAAVIAELKTQADQVRTVIDAHRDEIAKMRGELEDRLNKLDPKLRDSVRKDAEAIEKAAREKNTDELAAKLREVAAKYGFTMPGALPGTLPVLPTGPSGKNESRPLPSLPANFTLPSHLPIPSGALPSGLPRR